MTAPQGDTAEGPSSDTAAGPSRETAARPPSGAAVPAHGPQPLAVFDFGKTNTKLFVFAPDLTILDQERCPPVWTERRLGEAPCSMLDSEALWQWMTAALARAVARWPIGGIMITTHGCTAALVDDEGLTHPIVDYESEPPPEVGAAYARSVPSYEETHSPLLPGGLNLGRQLFWIESARPEAIARARHLLYYPQYWCWMLGAPPTNEMSSLGCHSHLWSPRHGDFSSLVDAHGWRRLFPPLARAGAVLSTREVVPEGGGAAVALWVHNGVHDSNASLYFYRSLGHTDCTVVSTGTWVIIFNLRCPLDALDGARDTLCNITVDGELAATARFMGGREYDLLTQGARCAVDAAALERAIARGQFALPSFAPGGPYTGGQGRLVGPPPESELERAAIGTLYLACMSDTSLQLIRSDNELIVDGGLAYNPAYLGLLAALRQGQTVLSNRNAEGSASGAAALAYEALGHRPPLQPCAPVSAWQVPGLADYLARWRELAEAHAGAGARKPARTRDA